MFTKALVTQINMMMAAREAELQFRWDGTQRSRPVS